MIVEREVIYNLVIRADLLVTGAIHQFAISISKFTQLRQLRPALKYLAISRCPQCNKIGKHCTAPVALTGYWITDTIGYPFSTAPRAATYSTLEVNNNHFAARKN